MIKKFIKGRLGVFIDAANIFYSQADLGWRMDYLKLKSFLESQAPVSVLGYYTGKVGTLEKQMKFIRKLENSGYKVASKELKYIKLGGKNLLPKGNLDVELALDAYISRDSYDTLLLFSGDSDFAYLLDLLKAENKNVMVFSTRGHVSVELLARAKFVDINRLKDVISYKE